LRASQDSDDTQSAYRVAAFQTFLSGRISAFGDRTICSMLRHSLRRMLEP
jgi:hypothetical protein